MFKEMGKRSEMEAWRLDGVGTCQGMSAINKTVSEFGITGPSRKEIIRLREERARQFPGNSNLTSCPYHREDYGCVLGDLKSPVCTAVIDSPEEIKRTFGIDGFELRQDITLILRVILDQDQKQLNILFQPAPSIKEFFWYSLESIQEINEAVCQLPILEQHQRINLNWLLTRSSNRAKIESLWGLLEQAAKEQDFEMAAKLRDRIHILES